MRRNFPRYHSCSPGWGALTGPSTSRLNATTRTKLLPQSPYCAVSPCRLGSDTLWGPPVMRSHHPRTLCGIPSRGFFVTAIQALLYHIFHGLSRLRANFFAHSPRFSSAGASASGQFAFFAQFSRLYPTSGIGYCSPPRVTPLKLQSSRIVTGPIVVPMMPTVHAFSELPVISTETEQFSITAPVEVAPTKIPAY